MGRNQKHPPATSRGVERLRRYQKRKKATVLGLAEILGLGWGQVSRYLRGTRTPTIKQAVVIEEATKKYVKVHDWAKEPEQ